MSEIFLSAKEAEEAASVPECDHVIMDDDPVSMTASGACDHCKESG